MNTEFAHLNLHPQLLQAISERGYAAPTPIQDAVIPLLLAGEDVIGQAQTGTGKTAAFALPILQRLELDQSRVKALVLAPTRELATQVAKAMYEYGQYRGVRVLAVYGGQPYSRQIRRLRKGVDVVVGTPGRLLDLIRQGVLDLSGIEILVLDEADEMLSMGFIEDIETILEQTPDARQTALFSATMPDAIRRLAGRYMHEPRLAIMQRQQGAAPAIEQRHYVVNGRDKLAALTRLCEVEDMSSALIFVRTRADSSALASELTNRGFPAEALNGDLSQDAREHVLSRFRRGKSTVLVATDVAARGLDIDDISHVFNYDLPQDPESYVHRVGRTGRAGKTGIAITLLTPQEHWRMRRIEKMTKQQIPAGVLPGEDEILARRDAKMLEQMQVWLRRGRGQREREIVDMLVAEGHDPLEIATAALKLARAGEKQRPIAHIADIQAPRAPRRRSNGKARSNERRNGKTWSRRSHEAGMVRLVLSAGRMHGIRPNDVVGVIAGNADIPGYKIGAIRIQQDHTFVDVPEELADRVLARAGAFRIRRHPATLAVA